MKKRKSILILTLSTFKYDARVKTYVTYLKENGYEVVVISSKEKKREPSKIINNEIINYRVITKYQGESGLSYILYYIVFLIKCFFKISVLSFKKKFDIIHYNNAPNFIIFSAIIQKIMGAKIILDNHDIFPLVFSSKFKSAFIYKIALSEQKLSMNFANKILCADHNQFDYLTKSKIKKDKITVILNTPDPHFFKRKDNNLEEGTVNKSINMVYHGTISHRLGIDNILRAINLNKEKLKNFKFHLIGTGDFLEETKLLFTELDLKDFVIIYGKNIPVEDLSDYLDKMDIGIIANRVTDISDYMLPVKLLEYVYSGIPVIAPSNKIITRYFSEDMLCFYKTESIEEMADRILKLFCDKNLRNRYADKAISFSVQYNYRTEMQKYDSVLKELD